jgi:hypothetical protein
VPDTTKMRIWKRSSENIIHKTNPIITTSMTGSESLPIATYSQKILRYAKRRLYRSPIITVARQSEL